MWRYPKGKRWVVRGAKGGQHLRSGLGHRIRLVLLKWVSLGDLKDETTGGVVAKEDEVDGLMAWAHLVAASIDTR